MKRFIIVLLTAVAALLTTLLTALCASAEIRFSVTAVEGEAISEAAASALRDRVVRGLSRVEAVSDNAFEVFDVVPSVEIHDEQSTEGLVREVARIRGDLTLRAVNRIDGTLYHSVTLPMSASATGGMEAAMKKLPQSIKPTDPVFVRFVRQAREKIEDYYASNCATIITQAQLLADTGRAEEAACYLSGVSAQTPCFDTAAALLRQLALPQAAPDTAGDEPLSESPADSPAPAPEAIPEADTAPIPQPAPEPAPAPQPEPQPAPAPAPAPVAAAAPQPQVVVHADNLKVRVLSCRGDLSTGRIVIRVEIINLNSNVERGYCQLEKAFSADGEEYTDLNVKYGDRGISAGNFNMPYELPVKMEFYIDNVRRSTPEISYAELGIRNVRVDIRGLAVEW